ncbi:MAG TPA: SMC-Scp complex subunit ScpB [Atribacteraceae bacterium]|nr:SMC-Scp complex subunit ScpB [Atribacteraceae bacterium]
MSRFERMTSANKTPGLIEAYLFASPHPVSIREMSELTGESEESLRRVLEELTKRYSSEEGSLVIRQVADTWQMMVLPEYGQAIKEFAKIIVKKGLSRAALETLALISLFQPITKAAIDLQRGADSAGSLKTLLERGLVHIDGYADKPGKPYLYRVTRKFYQTFGIDGPEGLERLQRIIMVPGEEPVE